MDPAELRRWTGSKGFLDAWAGTRAARGLDGDGSRTAERWLELLRHVEPLRAAGLDGVRTAILDGELDADDAATAFERGLAESSLEERSFATGLQDFDARAHERNIDRFTTAPRWYGSS